MAGCISPARTIAIFRSGERQGEMSGRARSAHQGAIATSVGIVGNRAPQRESDRVAHPDRVPTRGLGGAEARGPCREEPTDLLVRDHEQLRVDRSHDPPALPLLLSGARPGGACLPLALEPLHLRPRGGGLPVE